MSASSPARNFWWTLRRELWENRSIYLAPLIVAGLFLIGFFVGLVRLPERMRAAEALAPIQRQEAMDQPYVIVAMALMAIALLVSVFYSLDALYGERRDRSILFWKSMPVSDLTTVLAKASVPILVIPLVTFAVTMAATFLMLLLSGVVLAASGLGFAKPWTEVPFLEAAGIHFAHLVGFHGIGYAPLFGWLLLVSAWAKRAPFLWATLPPLAIGALERLALGTSHFARLVQARLLGGPMSDSPAGGMTMEMFAPDPWRVLVDPGLWLGVAVGAAFLLAAVRLRRSRGPI
ncbi:MAG TPA: ABC transporter permease [Gemmatimonadota bacterium]|nr:ABC transporter permease [Gemmatimonadota bacterium]